MCLYPTSSIIDYFTVKTMRILFQSFCHNTLTLQTTYKQTTYYDNNQTFDVHVITTFGQTRHFAVFTNKCDFLSIKVFAK